MKYIFNTIGLIGKLGNSEVTTTLNRIITYLRRREVRVLLDEQSATLVHPRGMEVVSRRTMGRQCDLAIVVGGDGTLLNSARTLVDFQVPILGVNLGRLGFLVDVSPTEFDAQLDQILAGNYREELRSLLHAQINRNASIITEATALNDVVIHKSNMARMIEVEAFLDGQFISAYRADGLIIATPTGSTAYALSCGGPIVHPSLEPMLLVPICPHTLTQRPLLLSAEGVVELHLSPSSSTEILVTCDGQVSLEIQPNDRLMIRKKRRRLRLLHPVDYDYFELLRAKLHWGMRPESAVGRYDR
jgi:NAD+ kinase